MQPGILFDGVYKTKMMVEPNPETLNSQAGCCFGSADPVVRGSRILHVPIVNSTSYNRTRKPSVLV